MVPPLKAVWFLRNAHGVKASRLKGTWDSSVGKVLALRTRALSSDLSTHYAGVVKCSCNPSPGAGAPSVPGSPPQPSLWAPVTAPEKGCWSLPVTSQPSLLSKFKKPPHQVDCVPAQWLQELRETRQDQGKGATDKVNRRQQGTARGRCLHITPKPFQIKTQNRPCCMFLSGLWW